MKQTQWDELFEVYVTSGIRSRQEDFITDHSSTFSVFRWLATYNDSGGVYMILVRVSFWYEFIPVLAYRSLFVYMIPVKNLIPVQLIPV